MRKAREVIVLPWHVGDILFRLRDEIALLHSTVYLQILLLFVYSDALPVMSSNKYLKF